MSSVAVAPESRLNQEVNHVNVVGWFFFSCIGFSHMNILMIKWSCSHLRGYHTRYTHVNKGNKKICSNICSYIYGRIWDHLSLSDGGKMDF